MKSLTLTLHFVIGPNPQISIFCITHPLLSIKISLYDPIGHYGEQILNSPFTRIALYINSIPYLSPKIKPPSLPLSIRSLFFPVIGPALSPFESPARSDLKMELCDAEIDPVKILIVRYICTDLAFAVIKTEFL